MKKKNVTVQLDEQSLRLSRHAAVDQDLSLSEWIAGLIQSALRKSANRNVSKRKAMKVLNSPLRLGGKPLDRESLHER